MNLLKLRSPPFQSLARFICSVMTGWTTVQHSCRLIANKNVFPSFIQMPNRYIDSVENCLNIFIIIISLFASAGSNCVRSLCVVVYWLFGLSIQLAHAMRHIYDSLVKYFVFRFDDFMYIFVCSRVNVEYAEKHTQCRFETFPSNSTANRML